MFQVISPVAQALANHINRQDLNFLNYKMGFAHYHMGSSDS